MLRRFAVGALLLVSAASCGKSRRGDDSASGGSSGAAAGDAGAAATAGGGVAGTSGQGGASGAAGGGMGGAAVCGERDSLATKLQVAVLDPESELAAGLYAGPAVVERSIGGELVVTFEPRDAEPAPVSGASGAAGATATNATFHVTMSGAPAAAHFMPGTKLWLTWLYGPPPSWFSPTPPWSVSLRDRENGTLLFGASSNDFDSAAAPFNVGARTPTCLGPSRDQCAPNATVTYSSLEVLGDEAVVIDDSTTDTVTLGGIPYDVRVHAQSQSFAGTNCADYYPPSGAALDVAASELAALTQHLVVGDAPLCRQGNDPRAGVAFTLSGVDGDTTYDGSVSYRGLDPDDDTAYLFDVLVTSDRLATLSISGAAALMPEPAVGQEFWLSLPSSQVQGLRESQHGPLLLAQGWSFGNDSQPLIDGFSSLLGVPVRIEDACEYAPGSMLRDTVFETTPGVRVPSGAAATLVLDGHASRVWTWSQGYQAMTLYPAD